MNGAAAGYKLGIAFFALNVGDLFDKFGGKTAPAIGRM
jgi:hypothetical protein